MRYPLVPGPEPSRVSAHDGCAAIVTSQLLKVIYLLTPLVYQSPFE